MVQNEQMAPSATMHYIEALDAKYPNAIPIFGGAIFMEGADLKQIALYLPQIIRSAEFFRWHDTLANACRTFCHCLFIDPALMEVYLGETFEELVEGLFCLNLD